MASGPWDKYKATEKEAGPWSKYSGGAMPEATPDISKLESGLRGAAEYNTFGFAPAISGAVQALPEGLKAATEGSSMADVLAAYNKAREASTASSNKQFKAAEEANPITYHGTGAISSLIPAALTGGVSEAGTAAMLGSKLTRGLLGAKTVAGALTGAGYGALSGAGHALSEGKDLEEGAKEVGRGLAGGALLGGVVGKAASALGAAPEALDKSAAERALKATGVGKGQLKNLLKQDIKSGNYAASSGTEAPESSIQKMGSLLLEKNPYQETAVVTAGATPEVIMERSQDLAQKAGADIGTVLKQFDQTYTESNPTIVSKFFNPADSAKTIENQLLDPLKVNGEISPVASGTAKSIQNVLDTIKQYGNSPIPFEKAQELKTLLTSLANYETEGSAGNQVLRRAGGIINADIEAAADNVAKESNMPDLMARYMKAKDLYKTAATALNASTGKVAGGMTNQGLGITDYMAGVAGAAAHGTGTGMLAAAGSKLAKTYGNTAAATGARATSNILSGLNSALVDAPKETIVNLGNQLIGTGGALESSLGRALVKAGERDDVGRNALIFSLMQNSGYRDLLRKHMGGQENVK